MVEARPKALGRGLDLLRFVPDDQGFIEQAEDGSVAGPDHRLNQFPTGKWVAGRRKIAAADAGLAQQFAQLREDLSLLLIFSQRKQRAIVYLEDRSLRFDIEAANGFNQIAEHIDTDGFLRFGREYVQDAAADGIFADHFHRLTTLITYAFEVRDHSFEREFVAYLKA